MTCVAEIDEAGRILIPEQMREQIHVRPGDKLVLEVEGRGLHAHPEASSAELDPNIPGRLVEHNGRLVFHLDQPLPPDHVD